MPALPPLLPHRHIHLATPPPPRLALRSPCALHLLLPALPIPKPSLDLRRRSTGISLYYQMDEAALKGFTKERQGNDFLVNLIDSPGERPAAALPPLFASFLAPGLHCLRPLLLPGPA